MTCVFVSYGLRSKIAVLRSGHVVLVSRKDVVSVFHDGKVWRRPRGSLTSNLSRRRFSCCEASLGCIFAHFSCGCVVCWDKKITMYYLLTLL